MMFRFLLAATIGVTILGACSGDGAFEVSESSTVIVADYFYEIPEGAGEALDAGTPLEILPAELKVKVGEIIEIVNDDSRGHSIGPFFVGAHETLRQRFTSPGDYVGLCTVHPSGEIVVNVTE